MGKLKRKAIEMLSKDDPIIRRTYVVIQNDPDLLQLIAVTDDRIKAIGYMYDYAAELIEDHAWDDSDFMPSVSPIEAGDDDSERITVNYAKDCITTLMLL